MKIETFDELDIVRKRFNDDFNGKPPDYLMRYLDGEEQRILREMSGNDVETITEIYDKRYKKEYASPFF